VSFGCLLKSNSDRAIIVTQKTATTEINVLIDNFIELPVEASADEVGSVVVSEGGVGFDEGDVEMEASGMVIVCVLLQLLDIPVKVKSHVPKTSLTDGRQESLTRWFFRTD
jgi:hypothetical protein